MVGVRLLSSFFFCVVSSLFRFIPAVSLAFPPSGSAFPLHRRRLGALAFSLLNGKELSTVASPLTPYGASGDSKTSRASLFQFTPRPYSFAFPSSPSASSSLAASSLPPLRPPSLGAGGGQANGASFASSLCRNSVRLSFSPTGGRRATNVSGAQATEGDRRLGRLGAALSRMPTNEPSIERKEEATRIRQPPLNCSRGQCAAARDADRDADRDAGRDAEGVTAGEVMESSLKGRERKPQQPGVRQTGVRPLLPIDKRFGVFPGPAEPVKRLCLSLQDLKTFCKDHAIVVPAAELYGGLKGTVDFGAVGHRLLQNLRRALNSFFLRDACEPLSTSLHRDLASLSPEAPGDALTKDLRSLPLLLSPSPPRHSQSVSLPEFRWRGPSWSEKEPTEPLHPIQQKRAAEQSRESRDEAEERSSASNAAWMRETQTDRKRSQAGESDVCEEARERGEGRRAEGAFIPPPWGPIFAVETACLGPAAVWAGSGHTRHFVDSVVRCRDTGQVFRTDSLVFREKEIGSRRGSRFEVRPLSATALRPSEEAREAQRSCADGNGEHCQTDGKKIRERDEQETEEQGRFRHKESFSSWRLLTEAPLERFPELPSPVTGRIGALSTPYLRNLMLQTRLSRYTSLKDTEPSGERKGGEEALGYARGRRGDTKGDLPLDADTEESAGIFRPETAQEMLISYRSLLPPFLAPSLPFGIAQEGRSWRNELISTSRFLFRLREFRQFEIEYFLDATKANSFHTLNAWIYELARFFTAIGLPTDLLSVAEQGEKDRSHYSSRCVDFSFRFPFGDAELCGISLRGDNDLRAHQQHSGQSLALPPASGSSSTSSDCASSASPSSSASSGILPHVVEPSVGLERLLLALLASSFVRDTVDGKMRTFLNLHPALAPFQAAVFPVVTNVHELTARARRLCGWLRERGFSVLWDFSSTSIGRRYRRADGLGIPFCFTLDRTSLNDGTVTVRWRNSAEQRRLKFEEAESFLKERTEFRFQDFCWKPSEPQRKGAPNNPMN
ncbi:anticodon binding domain-containing protein [Toxoplasma gondii ARI]|uniref:Anticodon binding domain-containing protein n=2 Tax=Toxoplasma gondii TaxID=5811 RepID=A0A139XT33_TOXGO|nr:anticodon binding domain-containing protein [Toxoplasma gondii ARI]